MSRPPLDGVTGALARAGLASSAERARRAALSRRSVLAATGGMAAAAALSACGTGSSSSDAPEVAEDRSETDKNLVWSNWTLYLDYDEKAKKYPTLERFKKETGINVTYREDIEDNDVFNAKIEQQMRDGDDIGSDIIVFTDWMADRYVRQGWVQELDRNAMPNTRNLLPQLENVPFDPGRERSMTWQSGFGVVAWNKERVPDGINTVSDLWDPKLKGRVEVLSEMRDTMGLILLEEGVDITQSISEEDFNKGLDVLQKQIDSGQVRQVKGNSYKDDLISGDALAVIGWSGDIFQLNAENGDRWGVRVPEAGGTLWSDNLLVPAGSPRLSNAQRLMDYYYDPKVAAEVAAWVNYVCPVQGAREEMEKIDPELASSPWIFPDDEFLETVYVFTSLSPDEETKYSQAFQQVIGF
jgi:spermidine/putrescine transport system substrate-binding protein